MQAKEREEYLQSRDDDLESSRVPYSDPTRLLVTVVEGEGGGGGGGGGGGRIKKS